MIAPNPADTLLSKFSGLRILVLGDVILDSYLEGETRRICREAPVPIVEVSRQAFFPGGAANTAANIRSLGATPLLLSITGKDESAERLAQALRARGIESSHLYASNSRETVTKTRLFCSGQLVARFDQGTRETADVLLESCLIKNLSVLHEQCNAVTISDYGSGTITDGVLRTLTKLQRRDRKLLFIDSRARCDRYSALAPTCAKPNFEEARQMIGSEEPVTADRIAFLKKNAHKLYDLTKASFVVVTLDREGALLLTRDGGAFRTYSRPVLDSRANGAGDTFLAALVLSYAAGATPQEACSLATRASQEVLDKNYTACCSQEELRGALKPHEPLMKEVNELARLVAQLRLEGKRIVLTNGCFDLLHSGHVEFLRKAKALGDVLIVAINGDESIRRLKGEGRPINRLADRLKVMSSLSCIDYLTSLDQDDARHLVYALRLDLFVKGENYRERQLPEADAVVATGGNILFLDTDDETSTSNLIQRIVSETIPSNSEWDPRLGH